MDEDLQTQVISHMDFHSLMVFRVTSRPSYYLARSALNASLDEILSAFVPHPAQFRDVLMQSEAYMAGVPVLHFFLRFSPIKGHGQLDILTYYHCTLNVIRHLLHHQNGVLLRRSHPHEWGRGVNLAVEIGTGIGRIVVRRSHGHALLPLCHAPSSALMAYLNPQHFGLLWPRLTFNRRAMPSDSSQNTSRWVKLLRRELQFNSKLWPWMWADFNIPRQHCARAQFLCPAQERFFTDDGALHGSFDPLVTEPMTQVNVAFRLCRRGCRRSCDGQQTYLSGSRYSKVVAY